jgi:ribosomal protein L11 methyltransferase
MPRKFVEVSIRTEVDSGELLAMLQEGETLGSWDEKGVLYIYWPEEKWSSRTLEDLRQALASLGVEEKVSRLTIREIADKDWNATWAASLHPIQLGRKIRIRQSWHSADQAFNGIELIIDPKRAFGTGHHTTTQLVIEWLEDRIHGGEHVLDVGTGTGILAMAAIRLGADSALAIDNDPVTLECARECVEANGFGRELELRLGSFEHLNAGGFDVIVANLDGKTLPKLCGVLPELLNAGGVACLSGLQPQDHDVVAEALSGAGLQVNARMQREEWLAIDVSQRR